jgi:superfamily I DNA/RNA helicase
MIRALDGVDGRIADAPLTSDLILITGPSGSGKSDALALRYAALAAANDVAPEATLVASSHPDGARDLVARIAARLDEASHAALGRAPFAGITLDRLALAIVADGALVGGLAPDIELLDPDEIEEIFERAAAPLFSAEWADYLGADIDPEISGLRMPNRFAAAVLRLIVKLRDAGISPETMLAQSLRGAAQFYGKPPNFADPGLLVATKDEHRSSLLVPSAELERQHRREIDLAKIVAKLYRSYVDELVRHGCLTAIDAVAEATRLLGEQPDLAATYRERLSFAVVDDAHDLRSGEVRLLQAVFGAKLRGVTFAGTLQSAIHTFAGARPEATFKLATITIALPAGNLVPAGIAACAQAIAGGSVALQASGSGVRTHRASDRDAEIAFVAQSVAALIAGGTPANRIAVVHRTARILAAYEDALVDADVPVALHGDIDLLARPEAGDALAALWSAVDPYRHAWLLRMLELPMLALGDISLGILCGEPANPQAVLFPLPVAEPEGDRRWDRRRDVRLAMNVLRGERDNDLSPLARERIVAFRERRRAWAAHARDAGTLAARAIIDDAGLYAARKGETPARAARRTFIVDAVLALIDRHESRHPGGTLEDALAMLARIAPAERGPLVNAPDGTGVFAGSIDRIGPRRFDHVFIVDARAGSFPPYYVPDAFLFSPTHGMVPKDAAGDAPAARTAKFTWYSHQTKLNVAYAREHRRLLALAMSRAGVSVTVSASGRATRGIGAPEFLAELQGMLGRA